MNISYKLKGIIALILCFLFAFSANVFVNKDNDEKNRYHQHLQAQTKSKCSCNKSLCSHLPLVVIDTDSQEIPGKPIIENNKTIGYTTASNGSTTITSSIKIIDNEKTNNHISDKEKIKSSAKIRVRGNTSRDFDKLSYYIKLVNNDETSNSQSVMGMDKHSEWALYGPYLDKTLIRNYMWYNIAGEIMDYSPNVRFCEVIINGEYNGLYLMTETITAGKDDSRLKLSVDKKDNTFNGYCLRVDRGSSTEIKNIEPFSAYTLRTKQKFDIVYPGANKLNEQLNKQITDDFSAFEKSIYSYDYDDSKYGYKNLIDVESFADYFIINEFTANYDAGYLSTYIYKDFDEKYRMCIWDFNSSCDNYQDTVCSTQNFEMQNCLWYFMLIKDEAFTDEIISRYKQLRKTYLSDEYLNNYIDDTIAYLGDAIDRNYEKWGYSFGKNYDLLTPQDRNPRNYDQSVDQLKKFISKRGKWMDENIEALSQYSAQSSVKKFNDNAN